MKKFSIEWWKYRFPNDWETKRLSWIEKTTISEKNLIKKYGEEEGKKRFELFKKRCSIKNREYRIEKFGITKYETQLNNYRSRKNVVSFQYFLEKNNFEYDVALREYKNRQNTSSLEKMIKKYGKEEGERRYKETNVKKSNSLENFIKKYGKEEGIKKYKHFLDRSFYTHSKQYYIDKFGVEIGESKWNVINSKKVISLENLINKYGKDIGEKKYKDFLNRCGKHCTLDYYIKLYGDVEGREKYKIYTENRIKNFNGKSKLEIKFIEDIMESISKDYKNVFYGKNQYLFITKNRSCYFVDLYIKELNLIVEIFGDFWHMNPSLYMDNDFNRVVNKTSKEIWENDKIRIETLKKEFGCDIVVIWESDIIKNKNACKKIILEKIYGINKTI